MRGALTNDKFLKSFRRIIPADAGSTLPAIFVIWSTSDHPRGCGEHHIAQALDELAGGSSPRMRGALHDQRQCVKCPRIIPADAGSTAPTASRHNRARDHPRGCGEHGKAYRQSVFEVGSSPRMRGALVTAGLLLLVLWIIPADAGSTSSSLMIHLLYPDHPRGCGEHLRRTLHINKLRGSSPRMRGARRAGFGGPVDARIIPADAGSTRRDAPHKCHHRDHPRGCGEHWDTYDDLEKRIGSSPRMRGAPIGLVPWCPSCRIIPADAGSTWR